MESFIVDNYSTYSTTIHTTVVQTGESIISDEFNIDVDFAWVNPDRKEANVSFLKMKMLIEEVLDQSIITHRNAKIDTSMLANNTILLPYVPSTDILAMVLHAKLCAVVGDDIFIAKVKVTNALPDFSMAFTYSDRDYSLLPTIEEFAENDFTHYKTPWWFRDTCETCDYFSDNEDDVIEEPQYYDVYEEINTMVNEIEAEVRGELGEEPEEDGEVIDFKAWKPTVVDE